MKKGKLPLWILGYAAVILVIAVVINVAMGFSIPTNAGLTAPTWLGFWGSYLGGAIGCIPALLALYDNRWEARLQHEESEKSRRLAAMPVIACEDNSTAFSLDQIDSLLNLSGIVLLDKESGIHNLYTTFDPNNYAEHLKQIDDSYSGLVFFDFRNIGLGPALNVSVSCSNCPQKKPLLMKSIGSSETRSLLLCVQIPFEADSSYFARYDIEITFSDIFGNHYVQVQPLLCRKSQHALSNISIPALV